MLPLSVLIGIWFCIALMLAVVVGRAMRQPPLIPSIVPDDGLPRADRALVRV